MSVTINQNLGTSKSNAGLSVGVTAPGGGGTTPVVVPAFETLVAGQTLTTPSEDYGSDVTVAGIPFKRVYTGSASPSALNYALANPTTIKATNISVANLNNSTTNEVQIGSIDLPGDSLINSKSTLVTITLTGTTVLPPCTISLGFSTQRTSSQYRVKKTYSDAILNTFTLELLITPIGSTLVKFANVKASTAPTSLPSPSGYLDLNLLGATKFPIFFKFESAVSTPNCSVTAVTAQAALGTLDNSASTNAPARSYFLKPFAADDFFNQKLSSTALVRRPVNTCNPASTGDQTTGTLNASGKAGERVLTLFKTAGLRKGMMPTFSTYRATHSDYGMGDDASGADQVNTPLTFDYGNYIESVLNSTQVLLHKPLLRDVNLRGTVYYGTPTITFAIAETLCMGVGAGSAGYHSRHFINGAVHEDYYAAAYSSVLPIVQAKSSDPIKLWTAGYIVGYNGFPFNVASNLSSNNGETSLGVPFYMKTPFDGVLASSSTIGYKNGDHNSAVVLPDGIKSVESFLNYVDGNGNFTPNRVSAFNLSRYSVPNLLDRPEVISNGHSQGNRAYGGSVMAGAIRAWELADLPAKPTGPMTLAQAQAYLAQCKANPIEHKLAGVFASHVLRSRVYSLDGTTQINFLSYRSQFNIHKPAIKTPGTGNAVGDVLYIDGGAGTSFMRFTVTAVDDKGGVVDGFVSNVGQYYADGLPPDAGNLTTTSSGAGVGCVLNALATSDPTITTTAQAFPATGLPAAYAFPATSADNDWGGSYGGNNPIGAVGAISKEVDLDSWFLYLLVNYPSNNVDLISAVVFRVCYAARDYGVVAVDRAGNTNNLVIFDSDCPSSQVDEFKPKALTFFNGQISMVENVTPFGAGPKAAVVAPVINSKLVSGVGSSGTTVTAQFPVGVTGTIQFTRTMLTAPYTKSNISTAVGNAVSQLSYQIQPADRGFSIGYDMSNQVTSYFAASVPVTAPDAPTAVTATAGNASITVTATAPASNGGSAITGWVITDPVTGTSYNTSTLPYTITGIAGTTARALSVAAVNIIGPGPSALSNSVSPTQAPVTIYDDYTIDLGGDTGGVASTNTQYTLIYAPSPVKIDSKRTKITIANPNSGILDYAFRTSGNIDYNTPSTWSQCASNTEQVATGTDASTNQLSVRPHPYAVTSLSSNGTTVTVSLASHPFVEGDIVAIANAVPAGYNGGFSIHVIDANTFSYSLAGSLANSTTPGVAFNANMSVSFKLESTK